MGSRGASSSTNKQKNETEFEDMPRGGFGYHGDGSAQKEFFDKNSNYNELIESMNSTEREAFDDIWVPGYFMGGQQYDGFENMSKDAQNATRTFDKFLDQSVIKSPLVVSRLATSELVLGKGRTTATLEELQAKEGTIVISAGNMSTGAGKQGLSIGSTLSTHGGYRAKNVEYKIHIPGGAKGAGMYIGDNRINSGFGNDQREFMMNRDIGLRVGKTTYDATRDVFVTHMHYTGRLEHNYTHY